MIRYITKIATDIVHLMNLHDHLANQLLLIEIDADTVISLAPHLKQEQLNVMSNGDKFALVPNFELYCTRISQGHDPNKVTTNVISIKCALLELLGEFFMRFATENSHDHCDSMFLP